MSFPSCCFCRHFSLKFQIVYIKLKKLNHYFLYLHPLVAFCRLNTGLYGIICNMYCEQCNEGTVCLFDYHGCQILQQSWVSKRTMWIKLLVYKTINTGTIWIHVRTTRKRTNHSLILNIIPESHQSTWFSYKSSASAFFRSTEL